MQVLNRLDLASREIIILTSFVGMSHPEAAMALGTSAKAVESRVARARAKLTALLQSSQV